MSDRLTVILPPVLSDEEREQAALELCGGSLTKRDGWGDGYGWGDGCGWGDGDGDGDGWCDGDGRGGGEGYGYAVGDGDGESSADV